MVVTSRNHFLLKLFIFFLLTYPLQFPTSLGLLSTESTISSLPSFQSTLPFFSYSPNPSVPRATPWSLPFFFSQMYFFANLNSLILKPSLSLSTNFNSLLLPSNNPPLYFLHSLRPQYLPHFISSFISHSYKFLCNSQEFSF